MISIKVLIILVSERWKLFEMVFGRWFINCIYNIIFMMDIEKSSVENFDIKGMMDVNRKMILSSSIRKLNSMILRLVSVK